MARKCQPPTGGWNRGGDLCTKAGSNRVDDGNEGPDAGLDSEDKCPYSEDVRYEWDPPKDRANMRTHGVRFSEAVTVLEDEFGLTREDPAATGEQRFVTLGMSSLGRLLVVVYSYRGPAAIRLISAWKANRRQEVEYEKRYRR